MHQGAWSPRLVASVDLPSFILYRGRIFLDTLYHTSRSMVDIAPHQENRSEAKIKRFHCSRLTSGRQGATPPLGRRPHNHCARR